MLLLTLSAMFVLLAFAVREVLLEVWLHRSACIRSERRGVLAVEIRRRVAMERLPCHVSEFPVPREQRILVNRVLGFVLWHREVSVALPQSACAHLEQVSPQDFDRQFPSWLQLSGTPA